MKNEIVVYHDAENAINIDVKVEDETVWLTQAQMVELFQSTKQNISLHINNIFKEKELQEDSVVKFSLTTASDGKKYQVKYYNLDVIISVGYRVKSHRGTQFRIWANRVLKDYLLKGYAVSQRMDRLENKVENIEQRVHEIDLKINTQLPPRQGIFFDGQVFDAHVFVCEIIKSATKSIVLIDNYIDESVLLLFSKRNKNVSVEIYTQNLTKALELDIKKYNAQYQPVNVKSFAKSHDRFLIIDHETVFHLGASLKDLGKKWFAFSRLQLPASDLLTRLQ